MEQPKATIKKAWPYQQDIMNLPVNDLDAALPFYEQTMGFRLISRKDTPCKSAIIARDSLQLGLAENGGDPGQDGCFFEVDDVVSAFAELKAKGLPTQQADFSFQQHGDVKWKVFFVVAPDGLCYSFGQRQGA
ncbi:VOC family protein [Fibrella sp. HMF5335]|uniref:VOC family protein n=1 Tax=Fibrella rubiginis TaxID=2817060 RepID=A0A939K4X3_9BACT|nr:VOC family protein [Fibrella rubiginis]MBO0935845.1 VOC family protein [Fibrella rubiginis]